MNQIISYIKSKNKRIQIFFYIQFIVSIIAIFILITFFLINKESSTSLSSQLIKTNSKLNSLYQINDTSTKYFGNLIIDKISLNCPIFSDYSEDNLKMSVCKFSGNSLNSNGNITIIGHNYNDKRFFGQLYKLEINDNITIEQFNNNYSYRIFKKYETDQDDLQILNPIYSNSKEITLVTCKLNSKTVRLVIKAKIEQ